MTGTKHSNTTSTALRYGMIGGGEGSFIGKVHRLAARMDGQTSLVCGTFSRDFENTQRTGRALAINESRLYSSYIEMFEKEAALPTGERIHFVVIATPNHLHVPVAKAALQHGFHVLTDKPVARDCNETTSLLDTANKTGLLCGVSHTYLGYPMVIQAKHLVTSGYLGQIRRIMVEYPQGWLSENEETKGNKQAGWRTNPATSGIAGCLLDIGTHASTLVEYICGTQITEVCADISTWVEDRILDDDAGVLFRTKEGARGTLVASQVCAGEENGLSIKIYGEKGGLEWRQTEPNSLIVKRADAPITIQRAGENHTYLCDEARHACRTPSGHPEGYLEAFANIYDDFTENVKTWPLKTTGFDRIDISVGARAMAFVEAAVSNNQTNQKWTKLRQFPPHEDQG